MTGLSARLPLLLSDFVAINLATVFMLWSKYVGGSLEGARLVGADCAKAEEATSGLGHLA